MSEDSGAKDLHEAWWAAFEASFPGRRPGVGTWEDQDEHQREGWRAIARRTGWCGDLDEVAPRHKVLAACEAWYPTFPHDKTWNLKNAIGAWIRAKAVRSE